MDWEFIRQELYRRNPRTTATGLVKLMFGTALLIKAWPVIETEHGQQWAAIGFASFVTGVQGLWSADGRTVTNNAEVIAKAAESDNVAGQSDTPRP